MRRSDHSAPFEDHDSSPDESSDLTEQFWGEAPSWRPRDPSGEIRRDRGRRSSNDDTTGAIRAIREGIDAFRPQRVDRRDPSGQVHRTRTHGVVSSQTPAPTEPPAPVTREATLGQLAAGWVDEPIPVQPKPRSGAQHRAQPPEPDAHDATALIPLTPTVGQRLGLGAVDPLLVRFGALVLIGVLLVPVAMSLRPSPEGTSIQTSNVAAIAAPAAATEAVTSPSDSLVAPTPAASAQAQPVAEVDTSTGASAAGETQPVAESNPESANESASTADGDNGTTTESSSTTSDQTVSSTDETAGAAPQSERAATSEAATVDAAAERVMPDCSLRYTAGAGDSWYRIAEAAAVTPSELLNQNRATLDTVIFPGDDVCLPPHANMPATPTTTIAPTTTTTTTTAPTTTSAPTTTAPSTSTPVIVSTDEVKRLIREIWPADQHEKALQVAYRESRYQADADNNFCCYGVFQIYFTVHQGWLDDFGIYTATDLFDARKNITAAYELYQRAGGWGPWGG